MIGNDTKLIEESWSSRRKENETKEMNKLKELHQHQPKNVIVIIFFIYVAVIFCCFVLFVRCFII